MVKQNQGFRRDLNLEENTNDTQTLNNIGGTGIANDLRIIQNNLRNISTVSYNTLKDGYFYFGDFNDFIFTDDDVVGVNTVVSVGSTTLQPNTDYYVCFSDTEKQFKLSYTPSSQGTSIIGVTTAIPSDFVFIRKDSVYQDNLINFINPSISDNLGFNYLNNISLNDSFALALSSSESSRYLITKKYKKDQDTTSSDNIKIEGSTILNDPVSLNTNDIGLSSTKSPGIFIGTTRAFSSDNNPWTKVGSALSTSSESVTIGELYFSNNITITGISTESGTNVAVTSFTHKLPVTINGEIYYLLLRT